MVIPAIYWLVLAIFFVIVEIFTLTFASFWFAISALLVSLVTVFYPKAMFSWQIQVLFWLIFSICVMIFWFKFWQPAQLMIKQKNAMKGGKLLNEQGIITKPPTAVKSGVIRFHVPIGGVSEWKCRSNEEINFGDIVTVINVDIDNKELIVSLIKK